jgi:hypothetical protein
MSATELRNSMWQGKKSDSLKFPLSNQVPTLRMDQSANSNETTGKSD